MSAIIYKQNLAKYILRPKLVQLEIALSYFLEK